MRKVERIIIVVCAVAALAAGCKPKPEETKPAETKPALPAETPTKETPVLPEVKTPEQPAPEPAPKADVEALAKGNNEFGLAFFKKLAANSELSGKNISYSPMSIYSALLMAHDGAKGKTRSQMRKVMKLTLDGEQLDKVIKYLRLTMGQKKNTLSIANRLWGQKGFSFLPVFLDLTKDVFGAGLEQVDFKENRKGAVDMINAWAAENTNNKIKEIVGEEMFDDLTRLVLTNAIYFNGTWEKTFDKMATKDDTFLLPDGTEAKVPMMNQEQELRYAEADGLLLLELGYLNDEMSMWVLLPAPPTDGKGNGKDYAAALGKLESSLTQGSLETWMSAAQARTVTVALPKFKTETFLNLSDDLKAMGMKDAFNPDAADFSGINEVKKPADNLYIASAVHKAYIDVNEEGTEAAAVTALTLAVRGMPPKPAVFRADHPFLYLIRDNESGCILFLGRVLDPAAAG
jgi:serpin B